jgi:hypothetical protein
MRKWSVVALLVAGATILGATVLREPIASAAQNVGATIIGPLDANGNVAVHEQGTVPVRSANDEVSIARSYDNCRPQSNLYTVPPAHTLVIEYMSATIGAYGAANAAGILTEFSTNGWELPFVFERSGPDNFVASEAVHYTVPGGTELDLIVSADHSSDGPCLVNVALGGHQQPAS